MNLVLFKRSLVNEVRSFCLQKHNLLRDLRLTISQTYGPWIVYKGFAVHGYMYGKSIQRIFLIENQGLGEIKKVYLFGKGRIRNTVLKFKTMNQFYT